MNLKFWQKRSLENPNTPLSNPASWLVSALQGSDLTPEQALGLTPIYNAITIISETVAQLPLGLYRREGEDTVVARDDPLHDLVSMKAYKDYGTFHWRQVQQAHALAWGNGYAHIERNMRGDAVGLRLLDAGQTDVKRVDGVKVYVTIINGKAFTLRYEDVLHIPAMAFDGLLGKSPITVARESVSTASAAQKSGQQFFTNGSSWGSTVTIPDNYGTANFEAMKSGIEKYKGQGYSGTLVLPGGAELKALSMSPKDAQFIEGRQFNVLEAARMFNIPADFLSYLEKSSFNNTTEMSIRLLRYTLTPWLVKWENELNIKLLSEEQRKTLFFKFNTGGLLRGTQSERYESYGKGINAGFLMRNEARALEDMNQIDGLSEPLIPLNMVDPEGADSDTDDEPKNEPVKPDDNEDEDRSLALINAMQPQLRHVANQLQNTLNKLSNEDSEKRNKDLAAYLCRNVKPVLESLTIIQGGDAEARLVAFGDWVGTQSSLDSFNIVDKLIEVTP